MKNSVSDRDLYEGGSDEDSEGVDEEGSRDEVTTDHEEESIESDDSVGSPRRSRPNSYHTVWPQSYRQSINIYSSVTPPTIGFLATPGLSRLGSSISSSFRSHTHEVLSSLIRPLLPTKSEDEQQQLSEDVGRRKSSQMLLSPSIPARQPSWKKDTRKRRSTTGFPDELPAASRQCSYAQAVINGINVLCGVGILSAPNAVKEGGWIGLCILLLYAVLALYTGICLRECLDSEPGLETYPDIGQAAFGTLGRIVISIILYLELYTVCVEHIILERDNLSSLFPTAHLDIGGFHLDSHALFAALTTLIVLPTTWLRDLHILSYISAGGVIASILVVVCLFWVGLVDHIGFKKGGSSINISGIPIAIGLYGYAYSGHAVFPNIYTSLKKPNDFPAVLLTSFAFCTILFAGVAAMGFAMFGDSTQSQFTLNMPQELVASRIAVWTTVVNPITKYALCLTPIALSLEELIPPAHQKSFTYSILIRTALTVSTLLVALAVPFFGLVMAFIGSSLTMLVSFVLPCACFLSIRRRNATWTQVAMCILTFVVGLTSSALGTISAVSRIINSLQ